MLTVEQFENAKQVTFKRKHDDVEVSYSIENGLAIAVGYPEVVFEVEQFVTIMNMNLDDNLVYPDIIVE
jgi:hypothetical protein